MPKNPNDKPSLEDKIFVGKVKALLLLKEQKKTLDKNYKECNDYIKNALSKNCKRNKQGDIQYTLPDGTSLELKKRAGREVFDTQKAMDLLNTLKEKTALKYIEQTTNSELIASAVMNGDISEDDAETLFKTSDDTFALYAGTDDQEEE